MVVQTGGKWIFVSDSTSPPETPKADDPPKADPPEADPPKADDPPKDDPPKDNPPKAGDPPKTPIGTPPQTPSAFKLDSVIGMSDHQAVEAVLSNWDSVKAYIES